MPAKLEDDELDYDLDGPVVSNFITHEHDTTVPRKREEASYPLATVAAFIMAFCLAHFLLVSQGFLGAKGMAKFDDFAAWVEDLFNKHSIQVPDGVNLI